LHSGSGTRGATALLILAVLLTAGCSGLRSNLPAIQVYTLQAAPPGTGRMAPRGPENAVAGTSGAVSLAAGTLQVVRPVAAPGLEGDHIALTRSGQRLDYYAGSRWPAELPALVQSLAIEALSDAGRFRAVQADAAPFESDYLLQIEVRHFEANYSGEGPPRVRVQLVATLGRQSDRSLLSTIVADGVATSSENRMAPVVAAFQAALTGALGQLGTLQPPSVPAAPAP
jgi:cholesterol transport system auxiliary component